MKSNKILFIVAAPSGAGKSTICHELLKLRDDLEFSISFTTRKPRSDEKHGVDYFFISEEQFEQKVQNEDFLEFARVHSDYYGTEKKYVQARLDAGKHVLLDIDVQGAEQIKKHKDLTSASIFIMVPSVDELIERIEKRGENSPEDILVRKQSMMQELKRIKEFDYLVINNELSKAVKLTNSIIDAEESKLSNLVDVHFK